MRIALNANRIIRVFDSEDLIMVTVDVAKNNTCKVVIAGGREFSVHCSVSKLVERLEPQMGGRFSASLAIHVLTLTMSMSCRLMASCVFLTGALTSCCQSC